MFYPIIKSTACIEIKKSKFISYLCFIKNPLESKSLVNQLWKEHPQARHIVWAFVVGLNGEGAGRSDDGEPSGTAGNPTLEIIRGQKLTSTLIATVRYFGGIKLGPGGLVRAYSEVASLCIQNCEFEKVVDYSLSELKLPYSIYDRYIQLVKEKGFSVQSENFGENIDISIKIPTSDVKGYKKELQELTNGQIVAKIRE